MEREGKRGEEKREGKGREGRRGYGEGGGWPFFQIPDYTTADNLYNYAVKMVFSGVVGIGWL